MRKLTKASVDALKSEMPVLEKEELEAVKGGGTVYIPDSSGSLFGGDGVNDSNLYVMSWEGYDKYWRQHCGTFDVTMFGATRLSEAPREVQDRYSNEILGNVSFLQPGERIEFVDGQYINGGSGGYMDTYSDCGNLVFRIAYGHSIIANKNQLEMEIMDLRK